MNKRIYDLVKNEINEYKSDVNIECASNAAIFGIFDNFFNIIRRDSKENKSGVKYITAMTNNLMASHFTIGEDSWNKEGVSFLFEFDKGIYSMRFKKYRDGDRMYYNINIKNTDDVKYSGNFIYKYLLFNALEASKLKGSYFTMPRNRFDWDIKTPEDRSFEDIFLPKDMMGDLRLYVDIYKEAERILRYLMVGNPGVGKTEATIVLARELNKLGVTIIKTPICDTLHEKVELANVLAPSLILLDDIDLSLGDRNKGAYSTLMGDFLDVMDGTDKLAKNVGVIATTNAAHLLDLAAQRPGRFDKTLLFDDITKDNIKNIIKKSLKVNFNIEDGEVVDMYTDVKIINKFYDAAVSGSHIYNTIKMLKLRYDTIKEKNVTATKIVDSIEQELKVISKVRKVSHIKEKFERSSGGVGFRTSGHHETEVTENEEIPNIDEDTEMNPNYS